MESAYMLGVFAIVTILATSTYATHSGVCYYTQSQVTAYTVYETTYYQYYYYYSCGWRGWSRCRGSSYRSKIVARTRYRVTYQRQSRCCAGYKGYPYNCRDIDECSDGLHCNTNIGNCTNTPGSYSCGCPDGYHVNNYRNTICNTVDNYTSFTSSSLSVHPSNIILDDSSVTLSCFAQFDDYIIQNNSLLISTNWYHNGALISTENGDGIDGEFRSDLTINPFQVTSVGKYICEAVIDGTDDNTATSVAVEATLPDPIVEMDIEYEWYKLNDTAILSCSAEIANASLVSSGKGVALIMSINGVPLDVYQSSDDSSIITSGTLLLQLQDIYFAREYTCRAYLTSDSQFIEESNIISSKSSLQIRLPTPDIYITSSFDDPAVIGSSAFLTCNITAQDIHKSSFALLQWEREGHSIKNETLLPLRETKKLFSFKFDHISKLLISDIKLSNAGLYSCSAQLVKSNATPLLLSSETKTITMMLDVGVPDPEITIRSNPSSRYYDVGDNLLMTCRVLFINHTSKYIDVDTNALFKWKKTSNVVVAHDVVPSVIYDSLVYELTYTLLSVALSDASLYTCEAIVSSDVPGVEDSNVMTSAINITVVDIVVTVTSAALTVLDYPGYNGVELTCSLSYQPTSILDVESVEWTVTSDGVTEEVSTGLSNNNRILNTTLDTPGTSVFTCSSTFVFDNGDTTDSYSHDLSVTVRGSQLPLQPYSPQHSDVTSTTAVISWRVTEVAYTPETYTIHYGTIHDDHKFTSESVLGPTDLQSITSDRNVPYSMILKNLKPFTAYYYYIEAKNTEGETESTTGYFNTEESIPGAIHNLTVTVISNTTVEVEWSKPTVSNGIIIGYEINVSVSREVQRNHFYSNLSFRHLSVELRLDPYVPYIISVAAFTLKGRGPIVESDLLFTEEGVPKRGPNYCSALRTDDGCISVSWNEVTLVEAGGIITGYNIYFERYTSFTCTTIDIEIRTKPIVITTDASNIEICDLPSVTSGYSVSIAVVTTVGEGPSSQLIVLPWIDELDSAMNISTAWLSDSCLRVEWIPLDTSVPVIYYTLRFLPFQSYECGAVGGITDEESILIYHQAISTTNIVCNLSPYFHYYLSVTATTSDGEEQEVDQTTVIPVIVDRQGRHIQGEADIDSATGKRNIQGGFVKSGSSEGISMSVGALVMVIASAICGSVMVTLVIALAVAVKFQVNFKDAT